MTCADPKQYIKNFPVDYSASFCNKATGFEKRFKRIQRLFKLEINVQTFLYFHNISLRNKISYLEFYISIFSQLL